MGKKFFDEWGALETINAFEITERSGEKAPSSDENKRKILIKNSIKNLKTIVENQLKEGIFEFTILSPNDREKPTCQIYYNKENIAEIFQDVDEFFIVELYPPQKSVWWTIPLNELQGALEEAKKHLLDEVNKRN